MGDRSQSRIYTELLNFLERSGISLKQAGSSEFGLAEQKALEFLQLLASNNVRPLGIEVWRSTAKGYTIDSLAGWASSTREPNGAPREAVEAIAAAHLAPLDAVTIQF